MMIVRLTGRLAGEFYTEVIISSERKALNTVQTFLKVSLQRYLRVTGNGAGALRKAVLNLNAGLHEKGCIQVLLISSVQKSLRP